MKKSIYKLFCSSALLLSFILFSACSFNKKSEEVQSEPKTKIENTADNKKASIRINAELDTSGKVKERKLISDQENTDNFYKRYLRFVLKGYNYYTDFENNLETIKVWNNYDELSEDTDIKDLDAGDWTFELTAYFYRTDMEKKVLSSGLVHVQLEEGDENEPVTFMLAQPSGGGSITYNYLLLVEDFSNNFYENGSIKVYNYEHFIENDFTTSGINPVIGEITPVKIKNKTKTEIEYTEWAFLIENLAPGRYWLEGKLLNAEDEYYNHLFCQEQMIVVLGDYIEKTYSVDRYTLYYELNGGEINSSRIDGYVNDKPVNYYNSGNSIDIPEITKDGFILDGWYYDEDFTKPVTKKVNDYTDEEYYSFNDIKTLAGDKTVYAKWSPAIKVNYHVYGVHYDGAGNNFNTPFTFKETVKKGDSSATLENFEEWSVNSSEIRLRHYYCGWYTEPFTTSNYTGTKVTSLGNSDIDLYSFASYRKMVPDNTNFYGLGGTENVNNLIYTYENFSDIPGCNNLEVKKSDTIVYTTTILTNKELKLKSDIRNSGTANYNANSNGQQTITIPANKITEVQWTVDISDDPNGVLTILLFTDKRDYDDADYLSDLIFSCYYSDVNVVKGSSKFVVWNTDEVQETIAFNMKNSTYIESNRSESADGLSYIYKLPETSTSNPDTISIPGYSNNTYKANGCYFQGWYDDREYQTQSENVTQSISNSNVSLDSKTYYAKWGLYAQKTTTEDETYYIARVPVGKLIKNFNSTVYKGNSYRINLSLKSNVDFTPQKAESFQVRLVKVDTNQEETILATGHPGSKISLTAGTKKDYSMKMNAIESNFYSNVSFYIDFVFAAQEEVYPGIPAEEVIDVDEIENILISDWAFTCVDESNTKFLSDEYMLYEYYSDLYVASSNKAPVSTEDKYIVQSTISYTEIDFVADEEKNVYVLDYDSYGNFFIVKNGNTLFSYSSSDYKALSLPFDIHFTNLYYEPVTKCLFIAGDNGHGGSDFLCYKLKETLESGESRLSYGRCTYRFEYDSPQYEMKDFAVLAYEEDGNLKGKFLCSFEQNTFYSKDFEKCYIGAIDFSIEDNDIELVPYTNNTVQTVNDGKNTNTYYGKSIVSYAELFEGYNIPDINLNDMQIDFDVQNEGTDDETIIPGNYLYVLFGCFDVERAEDYEDSNYTHHVYNANNYGFVSRIIISDSELGLRWQGLSISSTSGLYGLKEPSSTPEEVEFISGGEAYNIKYNCLNVTTNTSGQVNGNFINYLMNPQKFIAIAPKKLIFADDGMFIWKQAGNDGNGIYEVNRIVTIDLQNQTMSHESQFVNVEFGKETGFGASSFSFYKETSIETYIN